MSLPLAILRHSLGARILKTGLAVFAVLVISQLVAPLYGVYAAIAAFLAVQPSLVRSRAVVLQQLMGTGIGAVLGLAVAFALGLGPVAMSVGVVLLLVILRWLRLPESINLAVVMLLFLLERPEGDFLAYGLVRVLAVFFGAGVGYLVNRFVAPPDYRRQVLTHLSQAGTQVTELMEQVRQHLATPEALTKVEIKTLAARVQGDLDLARHYLRMAEEDGSAHGEVLPKAIASIGVFADRLMDLHKVLLLSAQLDTAALAGVDRVLRSLEDARAATYGRIASGERQGKPGDPRVLAGVRAVLAELKAGVEARLAEPPQRASSLTLHSVLGSLEHMLWRLESLERFIDADAAAPDHVPRRESRLPPALAGNRTSGRTD